MDTKKALQDKVDQVATDLENYAHGMVWRGTEDGEEKTFANDYTPDPEDWEQVSAWDYLEDALDYRVICDSQGRPLYAVLCAALGGPNIWVDCGDLEVKGYWGCDRATANISADAADWVNDAVSEVWGCR